MVNYKNTWFLQLRKFAVSSLKETQYLQIEPIEKETHTDESIMFQIFYLHGFVR